MKQSFIFIGARSPFLAILIGFATVIALATGLGKLYKDTRSDAFLSPDNPALVYKEKVKEVFGLSDPMVVAISRNGEDGIYHHETLTLVTHLTEEINALENINADRTISLATENNITGNAAGMDITAFSELYVEEGLPALRKALKKFPLYEGLLVSKDGNMTLIVAELHNENLAGVTYQAILAIIAESSQPVGVDIHVAGEGAVAGYLGQYIDADASRLNPLAALIITIMIIIAFRRIVPGILANIVIAGTVLATLGLMAHAGVAFFVITNSMPIILIGIAVADSIHIFSHYFETRSKNPSMTAREAVEISVQEMFRPVTLTTLTTMAGFIGLALAAEMPPFRYFGIFTAFGVAVAWLFSLFILPALMVLLKPKPTKGWIRLASENKGDVLSRMMTTLGQISTAKPMITIALFMIVGGASVFLANQLRVNYNRIDTFHQDQPIYLADKAMNRHMDGTNTIDIVIQTSEKEGLFNPDTLKKIEALQHFAETLPSVNGSTSIVDYLKQMHKSLNEGKNTYYALPNDKALIAQYFLLYSASGDPTDFEEEVDYDYQLANVRLNLNSSEYISSKIVVTELEHYIAKHFNTADGVTANMSGRVYLNYHWLKDLSRSHVMSVSIALSLVLLVSALLFKSIIAGIFAALPIVFSTLFVYAAMVILKIDLGIGTSMFASVAIGLGIDFSIHTIDRIKTLVASGHTHISDILHQLYSSTGRALFINYLAIACGFGVLTLSQVVPLNEFGAIVVLAVTMSFLASMTLLPALIVATKPGFIFINNKTMDTPPKLATSIST